MSTVAFINNYFPALSATFIYKEVVGLRKRGVRIRTFSIRKPDPANVSKESYDLRNSTTYLLPPSYREFLIAHCSFLFRRPVTYLGLFFFLMSRRFNSILKDRLRTVAHFFEGVYFAWMVRNDPSITHIHAHYASHPATLALVASGLTKTPFSFTAHASDIWVDSLFIKEKIAAARFVITCTKYGRNWLIENLDVENPEKIVTIYHGVDTERFKLNGARPRHSRTAILHVGRLSEEKAQQNIVMACEILKEQGYDFRCEIVGDGPRYGYLQETVARNNLQDVVTLVGSVDHEAIREYYKNADIFVLSSIRENLPNVLLEGLAIELPVIATDIAGIPELIRDGRTGLLVRPNDVAELAEAIKSLIDDAEYARRLAENGRKLVCAEFDVERSLDRIVELYQRWDVIHKDRSRFLQREDA